MAQDPTDNTELPSDPDATIAADPAATASLPLDVPPAIGPYRIIRRLGEGGMGEVFLAQQTDPIKRTVALKIIKPGMDTRAVVARFEMERQTLALMNHPGIARVYDAGQTEQGRPYFVMEYVEGIPITHYCDNKRLTTRQRLELVTEVCAGVQHAHQKAVIHRDLKPGNILITDIDGKPVPKIIDFGIARATEQREVERSMFTQLGHVIGTPAYMSPEQTDPTNTDIDTRTDIYSLGVVLYELLVGLTPFDTESVYSAGYEAIMKFVREQEAPRPSERLRLEAEHTTEIAAHHQTEPGKLVRTLKGDLDWILLKALDKDRGRRYETANALAMDIRRYLNDEAVLASPPSATYQASKFARRHRSGVAASAIAVVVLIAFSLTTALQKRVISHERDRAELESAKATAVNDFLQDMLVGVDPWASGDHDLTVVEAMDTARADVDSIFADQPQVAAEMHAAMGQAYLGLQKLTEAEEEVRQGLEQRVALTGPDDPDLADSWLLLARVQRLNLQLADAIKSEQEAVRLRTLHFPAASTEVLDGYNDLAELYIIDRQFAVADSVLDMMNELIKTSDADLRPQMASLLSLRAQVAGQGHEDLAASDSLFAESIDLLRECEPDSPLLPVFLNNRATNQLAMLNYQEARKTYAECLNLAGKRFGTDHPEYAVYLENLGGIAYRLGDYDECLANLEHVRDIRASKMGADHPTVLRTMLNMATVASSSGNPERAIAIYNEVLPRLTVVNGEIHLDTATTLRNLALALHRAGRDKEAEAAIARARPIYVELFDEKHYRVALLDGDLGVMRLGQGRLDEAEVLTRRSLGLFEKNFGPDDPRTKKSAAILVKIYEQQGRERDAARYRKYSQDK